MQKILVYLILAQFFCSQLYAQVNSPRINIERSRITVGELLEEISEQSAYEFSYNSRLIDTREPISFSANNISLTECLDRLSEKLNIRYRIFDDQIVLTSARRNKRRHLILSGFLSDRTSGESLIGATVHALGTSFGTFTNEFGYYSLPLEKGNYTIAYSHVGYKRQEQAILLEVSEQQNVSISPVSFDMPEVVIAPPLEDILNKKQLDAMELSPEVLNNMPEFAGESGLVKGLQSLPGLKADGDGSAYFYARGGERDQNLIIVDDAPIYNPSHLFGFYSMVIPDFTKSIRVYKGDMPASMGDRLSSIISIRTREGNLNKFHFSGAITPFVSRYSIETPIRKKKSSIFLTTRQSNFDWIYQRNNPQLKVKFQDFHLKWNRRLNDKNRLYFTTISSSDISQNFSNEIGSRIGVFRNNFAATFRWNHLYNAKLFSNIIINSGTYSNRLLIDPNTWKSELGMLGFKIDFTHYKRQNFTEKFGMELQGYFTNPGSLSLDSSLSIIPNLNPNYSRKNVLYYQGDWKIKKKWRLQAGVRLINFARGGPDVYYNFDQNYRVEDTVAHGRGIYNRYVNLDPRLSVRYQVDESSQLKLSFGNYHQYLQLISNSISPFTSLEIWAPAGPNIFPQSSQQWSLGYLKFFKEARMEISAAAYHKKMRGQVDYEPHATVYLNPLFEGELRFGETRSYGIEFLLKKDFGRLNGWLSYTYSRSFRRTLGINNSLEYPAVQDRPHDFSVFVNYQMSDRILASAYWTTYSGATFSSPTAYLNFNDQPVPIFGERNNDRLPTYNRMDISFRLRLNKDVSRKYQHSLAVSIYNVLGHVNPFIIQFNKIPDGNLSHVVKTNVLSEVPVHPSQFSLGRFLPSVSYRFKL
ncbi:MAG: carboxypeptidase-like regulatory domain-containing protein [Bacteroidia bacterium]|nr:carboxypeptidase-like regulatory domain-containing protein [Bacteroidia bacterium]